VSFEVLQHRSQISSARKELERRGVSQLRSPFGRVLRKLSHSQQIGVGDRVKSWDVLKSLQFLEQQVTPDAAVLDIGCFACELLPALHEAGFSNLSGVDLNPDVARMPYEDAIHYEVANFMQTPFDAASFAAITAISVIEHGYHQRRLLSEISRLLAPGGYFVASFDYWPEKIDTTGVTFFDIEWLIFSRDEVDSMLAEASRYGLHPVGQIVQIAGDRTISCAGKRYTFAWLALRKDE